MGTFISLNEFQCALCETTEMCFIKGSTGEPLWDPSLVPSCPGLLGKTEIQRNVSPTNCTQEQGSDKLHASLHRAAGKRTNLRLIPRLGGSNVRYDDQHGAWLRKPRALLHVHLISFFLSGLFFFFPLLEAMLSSFVQSRGSRCFATKQSRLCPVTSSPPFSLLLLSLMQVALGVRAA